MKKKKSMIKKQKFQSIFATILIVLSLLIIITYFAIKPGLIVLHYKASQLPKNNIHAFVIDTSNWQTYQDDTIGFSVRFPKSKRSPDEFPVKQYLSDNLSDGYRLTLTDDILGKGYYFQIIVHRNDLNNMNLLNYWKNSLEKSTGSSISCTQTLCTETLQNSNIQHEYKVNYQTVDRKSAVRITYTQKGYDPNSHLRSTEDVIIKMSPNYLMEINKGESATAEAILNSITFSP